MFAEPDLISLTDFFLLIPYFICFYFFLTWHFKAYKNEIRVFLPSFFVLKLLAIVINVLLIFHLWKTGDALSYFNESKNLIALIKKDFTNIKYLFLPVENYNEIIKFDNVYQLTIGGAGLESNFLVSRICAVLYPLGLGKFLLVNALFAFLSAIAQIKLYLVLVERYPAVKMGVAFSILFVPTVLFYGSPIFKETVCIIFLGFAAWNASQIWKSKSIVRNLFFLLVSFLFLMIVKNYVPVIIIISLLLTYLTVKLRRLFFKGLIFKIFLTIGITGLLFLFFFEMSYFDPYVTDFVIQSNTFLENYKNEFGETSGFELGSQIDPSVSGILKKSPLSFYTTYFRPHLWEANKMIILITAMESTLLLIFICYVFFKRFIYFKQIFKNDKLLFTMSIYIIMLGCLIGLTTFNFGTLARYKVPGVPFLWLAGFIILNASVVKKNKKMLSEDS